MQTFKSLCLCIVLAGYQLSALAAQSSGRFALGVAALPDYEGSNDFSALPALTGRFNSASGRFLELGGTDDTGRAYYAKLNVLSKANRNTWEFGPVAQLRLGRDDVEDNQVDEMSDLDDAIELGAFVGETVGPSHVGISAVADVSNGHDGFLVELYGTHRAEVTKQFAWIFRANLTYADSSYMESYFGVSAGDAAKSGLEIYEPDGGIKDAGVSLTGDWSLSAGWGLLGFAKYNRLFSDAADSPVVEDEGDANQYSVGLAVSYTY